MRHELMEKDLMGAGMSYEEAHETVKQLQGIEGDWDLWPTEMIENYSDTLANERWRREIQDRQP